MTLGEDREARRAGRQTVDAGDHRGLVRTAYLLTGDLAEAVELAGQALLDEHRRALRSAGPPVSAESVRRRLVRLAVSPWERWTRLVSRPVRRPPADHAGRAVVAERLPRLFLACLDLPARERAALVLRYPGDLSEAETGDALGVDVGDVHRLTGRGLARLGSLVPREARGGASASEARDADVDAVLELDLGQHEPGTDAWPGVGPHEALVTRLRAALRDAAAQVPDAAAEAELATPPPGVVTALRRARRRQLVAGLLTTAAAGIAVVLAVVTVVLVVTRPLRTGGATEGDVTTWPTRGDLAGRGGLVSRVRAVAGSREPVLAVPFVGDVAGLDVAIVVTRGPVNREVSILYGAPDAPVESWSRPDGTALGSPPLPVLSAAIDDGTGVVRMVVLTTTTGGLRIAWSPSAVMDADAFLRRRYTELPLQNGVGVASARGDVASFALRESTPDRIAIVPFTVTASPQAPGTTSRAAPGSLASSCTPGVLTSARLAGEGCGMAVLPAAVRRLYLERDPASSWC